jgi:hypothetical protein
MWLHIVLVMYLGVGSLKPTHIPTIAPRNTWEQITFLMKRDKVHSPSFADRPVKLLSNLKSVINRLQLNKNRTQLLHHGLQLFSKKPRHKTHCIGINFEFEFGLRQLTALNSYEIMTLQKAREIASMAGRNKEDATRTIIDRSQPARRRELVAVSGSLSCQPFASCDFS